MIKAISILFLVGMLITGCGSTHQRRHKDGPQEEQIEQNGEFQKGKDLDSLDILLSDSLLLKPKSPDKEAVNKPNEKVVEESDFIRVNFASEDNFIDSKKTIYWKEYRERDAVYQHIAIFDTVGALLDSLPNLRGYRIYLKDLLGDENKEIIVSHIKGNDVGFLPIEWSIYMLTPDSKLKKVFDYPKAYRFLDDSRKREFVCFINRFHFHARDSLRIETIFFAESCLDEAFFPHIDKRSPSSGHETKQFYLDKSAERFILAD